MCQIPTNMEQRDRCLELLVLSVTKRFELVPVNFSSVPVVFSPSVIAYNAAPLRLSGYVFLSKDVLSHCVVRLLGQRECY